MGTELQTSNPTPAIKGGAVNPFLLAAEMAGATDRGTFKSFASFKKGRFVYGKEGAELPLGTHVVVNVNETKQGWVFWQQRKIIDKKLMRVVDGTVNKASLEDHECIGKKDGWQFQTIIIMADANGGEEYQMTLSSRSANIAIGSFLADYGNQMSSNLDHENNPMFPVVELGRRELEGKDEDGDPVTYFAPTFQIVGWMSEEEMEAAISDEEDEDDLDQIETFDDDDDFDEDDDLEEDEYIEDEDDDLEEIEPEPAPAPAPAPKPKKKVKVKKATTKDKAEALADAKKQSAELGAKAGGKIPGMRKVTKRKRRTLH